MNSASQPQKPQTCLTASLLQPHTLASTTGEGLVEPDCKHQKAVAHGKNQTFTSGSDVKESHKVSPGTAGDEGIVFLSFG